MCALAPGGQRSITGRDDGAFRPALVAGVRRQPCPGRGRRSRSRSSLWYPPAGFAAVVVAAVGRVGLKLKGTTSAPGLDTEAAPPGRTSGLVAAVVVGGAAVAGLHAAFSAVAIFAMGAPVLVDAALVAVKPVEARLLQALRRQGPPAPGGRRPPGRSHHRLLWQDDDQRLCGPPHSRELLGVPRRPASTTRSGWPGRKRALPRHPGVRGRNGEPTASAKYSACAPMGQPEWR